MAWPHWTAFFGVIADGDHKVKNDVLVHVPRLGFDSGDINVERLSQDALGKVVDVRTWICAGAIRLKAAFAEFADQVLTENAAGAVPRAEEKNFQRWGCHGELRLGGLAWQTDIVKASLYENGELKK